MYNYTKPYGYYYTLFQGLLFDYNFLCKPRSILRHHNKNSDPSYSILIELLVITKWTMCSALEKILFKKKSQYTKHNIKTSTTCQEKKLSEPKPEQTMFIINFTLSLIYL